MRGLNGRKWVVSCRWNYSSRSQASASNTKHRLPLTNAGVCSRHHPAALGSTSSNISTAAFAFTLKPVSFMPLPKPSAQSWRKALLGPLKTPNPHKLRCRSTANGKDKPIQASRTQSGASPIGRRTILIRIGKVSHPMRTTATGSFAEWQLSDRNAPKPPPPAQPEPVEGHAPPSTQNHIIPLNLFQGSFLPKRLRLFGARWVLKRVQDDGSGMGIRESLAAIDNPFAVSRLCVSPLLFRAKARRRGAAMGSRGSTRPLGSGFRRRAIVVGAEDGAGPSTGSGVVWAQRAARNPSIAAISASGCSHGTKCPPGAFTSVRSGTSVSIPSSKEGRSA